VLGEASLTTDASRQAILKAIARARCWYDQLTRGEVDSIAQLALREALSPRLIHAQLKLVQLSPRTVERFLSKPESMPLSLRDLLAATIPARWREQDLGPPQAK